MNSVRIKRVLMTVSAAVLVALGLGPGISAGVHDLTGAGNPLAVGIAVVVGLFSVCLAAPLMLRRLSPTAADPMGRATYVTSIIVGLLLSALSLFIYSIDGANTTAWRTAVWLKSSEGIEARRLEEYGNHFGRLELRTPSGKTRPLAELPIPFPVTLSGGGYRTLVRISPTDSSQLGEVCKADASIVLEAVRDKKVQTIGSVPASDACGGWKRVDLQVPRGARQLRISSSEWGGLPSTNIDLMAIDVRPHFSWFWSSITFAGVGIFCGFVYWVARVSASGQRRAPNLSRGGDGTKLMPAILAVLLFLFAGNLFVYSFVSEEQTIYTWDNAGYWKSTIGVSMFIRGAERKSTIQQQEDKKRLQETTSAFAQPGVTLPNPGPIAALIRNIRFTEYNVTTSLPIAPAMALLGGSRMVYELSLVNVYGLAAIIMLILAVRTCGHGIPIPWHSWWPFIPVIVALLFVPFWVPIVRGYMGISTVAPNLAVLWLYFSRPPEKSTVATILTIGILLVAGVLLQRWNAFWVISFFVLAAIDGLYTFWRKREYSITVILQSFRVPAFAGLIALCSFAVIAWPKIVTIVTTDYADIYSAYLEHSSLFSAVLKFIGDAGLLLFLFVIASFLYLLAGPSTRRMAILLAVQVVFVFVHMSSTQTMGPHHLYVLLPALLIMLCVAFIKLLASNGRRKKLVGITLAGLYTVTGIFSMASVFTPSAAGTVDTVTIGLLSNDYRPPLIRNDLDEFDRLARFLDEQVANGPKSAGVYVLAGSQTLNPEHLRNIGPSLGQEYGVQDRLLRASIVDKRDGFPAELLDAYLVVISDPVQLSRRPEDQHVIQIPARQLKTQTGIGLAFERLPQVFQLDGGVEVSVFRRARPNTESEIGVLSDEFRAIYPDRPDVYER